MTEEPKGQTCSAYTDSELHDWLRWAGKHGSGFLRAVAEAAFLADTQAYRTLRPALMKLKEDESRSAMP